MTELVDRLTGPIWAFGWATIFYLFHKQKVRRKMHLYDRIHAERLKAVEKGVPYPELPPYIDAEEEERHVHRAEMKRLNPRWPLGLAAILVTGGAGTLVALLVTVQGAEDW